MEGKKIEEGQTLLEMYHSAERELRAVYNDVVNLNKGVQNYKATKRVRSALLNIDKTICDMRGGLREIRKDIRAIKNPINTNQTNNNENE